MYAYILILHLYACIILCTFITVYCVGILLYTLYLLHPVESLLHFSSLWDSGTVFFSSGYRIDSMVLRGYYVDICMHIYIYSSREG